VHWFRVAFHLEITMKMNEEKIGKLVVLLFFFTFSQSPSGSAAVD
jgi:hypothetical protein